MHLDLSKRMRSALLKILDSWSQAPSSNNLENKEQILFFDVLSYNMSDHLLTDVSIALAFLKHILGLHGKKFTRLRLKKNPIE